MPLHVRSDIVHRQAEGILGKLGVCFCQPADCSMVPDQEFAFGDRCRARHVVWRVGQQRHESDDVPWNLPQQVNLGTGLGVNKRPGPTRLQQKQIVGRSPATVTFSLGPMPRTCAASRTCRSAVSSKPSNSLDLTAPVEIGVEVAISWNAT